jgi:hypothetical protein
MMPMIRDFLPKCAAALRLVPLIALALVSDGATARAANDNQAPAPQASVSQQSPKPADGAPAPVQSQPARPQKVITTEDIEAGRALAAGKTAGAGKAAPLVPETSACDAECAAEARQITGFAPDREGEWQFLLASARRNLQADKQWAAAQRDLASAVQNLCTFEYQQQVAVPPSGSDWQSRVDRAQRDKTVENMTRMLNQKVSNANARMNRLIQQAGEAEPVRGAIMSVLASRVNNFCADSD